MPLPCVPNSRHLFLIPTSQGASYTQLSLCSPQDSPLYKWSLLFSKPLFYSDPYRICEGRLNCTCKCPLFIIHLCLLKTSLMKTLVGSRSNWSLGLGLEIGHQASWDFSSLPLHSALLNGTGQSWPSLGLSFPSPPWNGKNTTFSCWSSIAGLEV